MLETTGGGKILHKKAFFTAGFPGVEAQFTTPAKPELPTNKFMRVLAVNETVYTLNYWTSADSATTAADRSNFFSSLQLSARKHPAASHDTAYEAGRKIGQNAFYLVLMVAVVLLVRRLTKSKK